MMQAVVDHQYVFTDVYTSWPGRGHDARVFANSKLYLEGQNKVTISRIIGLTLNEFKCQLFCLPTPSCHG